MDKNIIKSFAIESRRQMVESVKYQASLIGITAEGINEPISKAEGMETYDYGAGTFSIFDEDIKKRANLVKEITNKGFDYVLEEVAYTWFNRIIAIRYLEVNDYLPSRTRVLSSETEGKTEPDIVTDAFDLDLDLDYTNEDKELIFKLKDENKLDELFQFLFIKQCNKLSEILPGLFEKTDDFFELLLKISFVDEESIIFKLINFIPESDFTQVEIIGWMYQYYNSELKDEYNNAIASKPIQKDQIPAVTQLFTPNWIVRYITDNSLGRYWIERNKDSKLKDDLSFYFEEPLQNSEVQSICEKLRSEPIQIDSLKFFDPCMGSGHILVYAFEIFMKIYIELGYIENEIPELILKNNLYGLDIDRRAYQLAYFALMMKSRQYDRRLLNKNIVPNVYPIVDSNINKNTLDHIKDFNHEFASIIEYLNDIFKNGQEFGSLIKIKKLNFDFIETKYIELINSYKTKNLSDINFVDELSNNVLPLIIQAKILSSKYEIVVTNPPYMNKYDLALKEFCKKHYKDYSKDLFSIFIYRNFDFCKVGGYIAFMTPLVWMYLKSFEKLRKFIINNKFFVSLIEMEYNTLWEIEAHVPGCNFILGNYNLESGYKGTFLKLSDFTGGLNVQKEKTLAALNNDVDYKFFKSSNTFLKIPGNPIAYWVDDKILNSFSLYDKLEDVSILKSGRSTSGLNNKLFKFWFEIPLPSISFDSSNLNEVTGDFVPLNKGGSYRKWYGNKEYVSRIEFAKEDLDFKQSVTWSDINSSYFSARLHEQGIISNNVGKRAYFDDYDDLLYSLGFLNTNLSQYLLDMIIPTLHFDIGYVGKLPLIENNKEAVVNIVKENISICKNDWDSYELSWDFSKHPLLKYEGNLNKSFNSYSEFKENQFNVLKNNEIQLNKIFNNMYDVDGIIDDEVIDKKVSVNLADYEADMKSFISYAVGCMFGRYSLDEESLVFAGGAFNLNNYSTFIPDDDNVIPVLDTEYFTDDIVGRFVEFVKICFGEETLEENLDFIAGALKKKGKTSREIIRNYFLTDFFKNHSQLYKKCPIYWQFDSGRQNAFKCLIYMHRYEPGIVARVRTDYLHKTQKAIEQNLARCDNIIANSSNKSEVSKATKDKTKYIKQLDEIKVYDEALRHMASQNIEIDLDDGVKVNYAKFQNVEVSMEGEKPKKINLLKKI